MFQTPEATSPATSKGRLTAELTVLAALLRISPPPFQAALPTSATVLAAPPTTLFVSSHRSPRPQRCTAALGAAFSSTGLPWLARSTARSASTSARSLPVLTPVVGEPNFSSWRPCATSWVTCSKLGFDGSRIFPPAEAPAAFSPASAVFAAPPMDTSRPDRSWPKMPSNWPWNGNAPGRAASAAFPYMLCMPIAASGLPPVSGPWSGAMKSEL